MEALSLSGYTPGCDNRPEKGGVMQAMAKKRKPGAGRPKATDPTRDSIASFRGSPEFATWFWELIEHCREKAGYPDIPASAIIERALICHAREMGFSKEPPKR
jgi:hypothetical protein